MEKIGRLLTRARPTLRFDTAEDAAWSCTECGPVPGRYSDRLEAYVRAFCACHKAQMAQQRQAWQQQMDDDARATHRLTTYGWIGNDFITRREILALESRTFESFDNRVQPVAYAAVTQFALHPYGTLILDGPYGIGKTHLLLALCQELHQQGKPCRFVLAPKFFEAIGQNIQKQRDYLHLVQKAIDAALLVIDDIDKLKWSEFREETWMSIIDSRVNANRPIALSTNNLAGLASSIGGACADRLSVRRTLVSMTGKSYRSLLK